MDDVGDAVWSGLFCKLQGDAIILELGISRPLAW